MNPFPVDRDAVTVAVGVAAAYATLSLVSRGVIVLPVSSLIDPASALPLPSALLLGPAAAWGAAAGVLARDLASGSLGPVTAFESAAGFLLGSLGCVYWRELGPTGPEGGRAGWRWLAGALPRLVLVAVVASCGAAAFLAWGAELLGVAPFPVAAVDAAVEYALTTLLVGLPLLLGAVRALGAGGRLVPAAREGHAGSDPGRAPRSTRRLLLVLLPVGWLAAGSVGAVGYRVLETVPPAYLADRGLGLVVLLYRPGLFGPGAVNVQVVLGSLVVVAFALLVAPRADRGRRGADA
jgi:hypothetical protein